MSDPLHVLIRDTLSYLKDPLLPRVTVFASAEECALFQRKPAARQPVPIVKEVTALPPLAPEPPRPAAIKETAPAPKAFSPEPPLAEIPMKSQAPVREAKPHETAETDNFSQIKKTLLRIAPAIKLIDEVPDDAQAKKVAGAWREKIPDAEVILLACETDAETLELLKSLGKAIDQHLARAKIVPAEKLEREKRWDLFLQKNSFRLIVASDGMQKCLDLMRLYRAVPASSQFFLDKTPLLPLSPASLYKSLEHKALLWKTLCQTLKK
ncbi:MAG: hypothetical protein JSS60_06205 [Verrucomicrobia bacterium]|nr:hypothetical protein [Verrucomicrobiota bacterium]